MIPRTKKGVFTENDLMMYFALIVKHLRLMVLLVCFSLLLGLTYYTYARPLYYAVSEISYDSLSRTVDTQLAFKDSRERFVRSKLASAYIKERTAERLGIKATAREIERKYIRKMTVRFTPQNTIRVEVFAYSYDLARDWAETTLQQFLLDREEKRRSRADMTVKTFSKEMEEMQERMDQIFNSKYDLRTSNDLTKITIELNHYKGIRKDLLIVTNKLGMMERTRQILDSQSFDTMGKLSVLSALEKELDPSLNIGQILQQDNGSFGGSETESSSSSVVIVPGMVQSPNRQSWEKLDLERRQKKREHDDLARTFLPKHPKMVVVIKQLEQIERALDLELEVAFNRLESNYATLAAKMRELEATLPAYHDVMRRYEKAMQAYKSFDSGQLAWSKLHADMEKRLNVLDFAEDKDRDVLKYLGYSESLRNNPVSPHRAKLAIYSLLFGFALAIAVPFLLEFLDSRISDLEDAEESLHLRGLGIVPQIESSGSDSQLFVGENASDHYFQENFRVIRANLGMNSETGALPQVIIVTSAMPQEGKTVVSSNLALSFATKGDRTLLIDADLRRGRLHRVFKAQNKPGLSDILAEKRPIEDAFRPGGHENLTLVTCGKHVDFACELLDGPSFAALLGDLRKKYDRIIIDTPPVLGLAETSIIQRLADGVVFVIWGGFTPMRNVKSAIQSLEMNGTKFLGFVLNRLDFHALGNRYKYFYYAPNYYYNYRALEAPSSLAEK
ncbi:MAG: polysaccharide biosynthesis tyrosine autokinase [Verrucomicrobia bacterium]|nr:polysaccharide biosynthesis tyrosine autokinase [Verrucomicrobiota bacterium]